MVPITLKVMVMRVPHDHNFPWKQFRDSLQDSRHAHFLADFPLTNVRGPVRADKKEKVLGFKHGEPGRQDEVQLQEGVEIWSLIAFE